MRYTNIFLSSCWWNYFNLEHEKQIEYLSPIAGSVPGWYLWLKKRQGVYEFILSEAGQRGELEVSKFLIKYYPHPEESLFDSFATAEQVVRLSPYFDDDFIKSHSGQGGCACSCLHHNHAHCHRNKGFPKVHAREKINPTLFTIGEMKLIIGKEEHRLLKSMLISQDRLLEYSQDGILLEKDGSLVEVIKSGELDRSIPAWELCWDLYDTLIKEVFAKMGGYPRKCRRTSKPGLLFYQGKGGETWSIETGCVTQITQIHLY